MKAHALLPDWVIIVTEHRKATVVVAITALGLAAAEPAKAQTSTFDGEFSVQRFHPAPGPRNFITTRTVRTDGTMAFSGGLLVNWGWEPLTVVTCNSTTNCSAPDATSTYSGDVKVVENIVSGDFMGSLTVLPPLQIGLRLPLTFVKGQGLSETGGPVRGGVQAVGLGDAELEGKYRLVGKLNDPVAVGAALFVTGPLGTATAKNKYIGDTLPTVGVRGIVDGEFGPLRVGANLIGVFRDQGRIGTTTVGSELRYGVAGAYQASPVFQVLIDAFGNTAFASTKGTNGLEADLGMRLTPLDSAWAITAGAGAGLLRAVGIPKLRAFLGALYLQEDRDRDHDGILDKDDRCPTEAEDRDGFEDTDGCPDKDNDGDSIADSMDKCPNEPEDMDTFQDDDGCPDPDNDKDGVSDDHDQCPDKQETKNGFKDDDGCPDELDKDNDGVPDSKDQCPEQPEDTDGYKDTDGCPDPDNDGDGIPDEKDECVEEPENVNGVQDQDGCPDDVNAAPGAPGAKPAPGAQPAKPAPIELD